MSRLQVGCKVKWIKNKEDMATSSKIEIGDTGIICDIDSTSDLSIYVVFNKNRYSDWFYKEELECVE